MLFGSAASLFVLFAFCLQNWKRSQVSEVTELKLNCLLTSSPLVFIPGKRSLFYFLAYWNEIPHWLASHGYEVFNLPLPWRNPKKRLEALDRFLIGKSQEGSKFHLFLDTSSLLEISNLLRKSYYPCLASVTLVGQHPEQTLCFTTPLSTPIEEIKLPESGHLKSPLFWILHRTWTLQLQNPSLAQLGWKLDRAQGDFLLERVQFLAERDLLQNQRSPTL